MHPLITDVYTAVLDTLLPVRCVLCKAEHQKSICTTCLGQLRPILSARCIVCQAPSPEGLTHIPCRSRYNPDRFTAVFDYTHEQVARSIIAGKYYFVKNTFTTLAEQAAQLLKLELSQLDKNNALITPLPLHSWRQRWRGFNQSAELAKALAARVQLPYEETLMRTRYTRTQKDLSKAARIKNVENCFALLPHTGVAGKNIVLIDDVSTTGSTLLSASAVLKQGGATRLWCLTLAQD